MMNYFLEIYSELLSIDYSKKANLKELAKTLEAKCSLMKKFEAGFLLKTLGLNLLIAYRPSICSVTEDIKTFTVPSDLQYYKWDKELFQLGLELLELSKKYLEGVDFYLSLYFHSLGNYCLYLLNGQKDTALIKSVIEEMSRAMDFLDKEEYKWIFEQLFNQYIKVLSIASNNQKIKDIVEQRLYEICKKHTECYGLLTSR